MAYGHTFLILGRISNLPTVWSNCLAGWWLGGGGDLIGLVQLVLGATFLYTGGMFLNDAYDAAFDRQYRPERPIPSGTISEEEVWKWGLGWLAAGALLLILFGGETSWLTVCLLASIVGYDAFHKQVPYSPVVMAGCRFFLFLAAATTGEEGIPGLALWSALALAAYIVGLSYMARQEATLSPFANWPLYLLASPIILALIVNTEGYLKLALLLALGSGGWTLWCLRHTFWAPKPNIGRTVSGLLAGIVLVDLIAIAGGTNYVGLIFAALFSLALFFQRYVPAT